MSIERHDLEHAKNVQVDLASFPFLYQDSCLSLEQLKADLLIFSGWLASQSCISALRVLNH